MQNDKTKNYLTSHCFADYIIICLFFFFTNLKCTMLEYKFIKTFAKEKKKFLKYIFILSKNLTKSTQLFLTTLILHFICNKKNDSNIFCA